MHKVHARLAVRAKSVQLSVLPDPDISARRRKDPLMVRGARMHIGPSNAELPKLATGVRRLIEKRQLDVAAEVASSIKQTNIG